VPCYILILFSGNRLLQIGFEWKFLLMGGGIFAEGELVGIGAIDVGVDLGGQGEHGCISFRNAE